MTQPWHVEYERQENQRLVYSFTSTMTFYSYMYSYLLFVPAILVWSITRFVQKYFGRELSVSWFWESTRAHRWILPFALSPWGKLELIDA